MKTVGIVGGLGPESTVDYYKSIVALYRSRHDPLNYPHILIDSINLTEIKGYVERLEYDRMIRMLGESLERLARAGADFAVLGANTAHIVFDEVNSRSPLPLISIVGCTCRKARERNLKRIGLLGTGFTMQSDFYPKGFDEEGILTFTPTPEEQAFIHEIIFAELQDGIVKEETRQKLVAIIQRMIKDSAIDGVALACTELPLVLKDNDPDTCVPMLNTTLIHVEKIVEMMVT
jgi:aspartate racemase